MRTPDDEAIMERMAKGLVDAIKHVGEDILKEQGTEEKLNPELVLGALIVVADEFIDVFSATANTKIAFWQDIGSVAAIKAKLIEDEADVLGDGDESDEETVH